MNIERIEQIASLVTGISIDEMHKKTRKREIVWARQLTMYFARNMTRLSWAGIGGYFDKDHATALHSHKRIDNLLFADWEIQEYVQLMRQRLGIKLIIGDWLVRMKIELTEPEKVEMCNNCIQL